MQKKTVEVRFTGAVTVLVPEHLPEEDANNLANKLAVARILATTDNPDAPEDAACEEYQNECSRPESAEADWDCCEVAGVGGEWRSVNTSEVGLNFPLDLEETFDEITSDPRFHRAFETGGTTLDTAAALAAAELLNNWRSEADANKAKVMLGSNYLDWVDKVIDRLKLFKSIVRENPQVILGHVLADSYEFAPSLVSSVRGNIERVDLDKYDDDNGGEALYDLFDQHGNCLNEGCPFPFRPTEAEVREYVLTGKITGKIG